LLHVVAELLVEGVPGVRALNALVAEVKKIALEEFQQEDFALLGLPEAEAELIACSDQPGPGVVSKQVQLRIQLGIFFANLYIFDLLRSPQVHHFLLEIDQSLWLSRTYAHPFIFLGLHQIGLKFRLQLPGVDQQEPVLIAGVPREKKKFVQD
jgi:hypothetical protein